MTPQLFEEIRINLQKLVLESISDYEKDFSKFKIDSVKQKFLDAGVRLLSLILDRMERGEQVSILPFKEVLLQILFELELDIESVKNFLPYLKNNLERFVELKPNYDANFTRIFDNYFILFSENLNNYSFYVSSTALDVIQEQVEYQYSESLYSVIPQEIDSNTNTIYTLFPSSRYWETYQTLNEDTSYSPISYNRIAAQAGFSKYAVPITYESLIIYNNELYKLRPGISFPTRVFFNENEWVKYTSRRFDSSKSFKATYESKILSAFSKISEAGFDVNSIISDSNITRYSKETPIDETLLSSTFGGAGKQVLDSVKSLKGLSEAFGGYEGSPIGGIEYIASFSEYLLTMAFGRNLPSVYDIYNGNSTFGKFDILFRSATTTNKIPGLKFLNGFGALKSFVQRQTLPSESQIFSDKVIYNPVYSQFVSGIEDRYSLLTTPLTYSKNSSIDLLTFAIETLYKKSLIIGDTIAAISNTLDYSGKIPGYEGLGSVRMQIDEFQRVFPPTTYVLDTDNTNKSLTGFTGGIRYLLNSYLRFSKATIDPLLPGQYLEFFGAWIERVANKLEEVNNLMKAIGITTSTFIPNISFKIFEANNSQVISYLSSLGFRDYEINRLLEAKSFPELITNFAPLSDSSDLKSFFKGYELAQLIYEFGGQAGVDAYLLFLYSQNPLDSLLNILSLSQKNKSKTTYVNMDKYPKLIGLLIGLTYAIDPTQLVKFNEILGKNNLTLLESISYLYQNGESTIIKNREDVDFLEPLVEQMITGVYERDAFSSPTINYDQANSFTPIALKQWTEILGNNLGGVDSKSLIERIYDRAQGLTPKELVTILNTSNSTTNFGALTDGFNGGGFANFLKYASLSGLSVKLGFYKNSYQTNNFKVPEAPEFYALPKLVQDLDGLIESVSIVKTVFASKLNYSTAPDLNFANSLDPLIYSQNKNFDVIPKLITSRVVGASTPSQVSLVSSSDIAESPGIGNSRLPNRVPVVNSITPEQAQLLRQATIQGIEPGAVAESSGGLTEKFIKFSYNNSLANDISVVDETYELSSSKSKEIVFLPATKYELAGTLEAPQSRSYDVVDLYKQLEGNPNIKTSALGANYISETDLDNDLYGSLVAPFDPVQSCKRFGGIDCEGLYADSQDRCAGVFNKALFPETYSSIPGVSAPSVSVDRPLGTFAEYRPNKLLIPTSSYISPSSYMTLLPDSTLVGEKGEPLLMSIFSDPIVYEAGGAELSEYGDTEFAIVEFIKAKLEKNTEFSCASFESPFYYQICMNIMKCKRFSPPLNNQYSLDFCPKTLSGGRLK
jgi:hypothetical protein